MKTRCIFQDFSEIGSLSFSITFGLCTVIFTLALVEIIAKF